jgi:hypothetical protein
MQTDYICFCERTNGHTRQTAAVADRVKEKVFIRTICRRCHTLFDWSVYSSIVRFRHDGLFPPPPRPSPCIWPMRGTGNGRDTYAHWYADRCAKIIRTRNLVRPENDEISTQSIWCCYLTSNISQLPLLLLRYLKKVQLANVAEPLLIKSGSGLQVTR